VGSFLSNLLAQTHQVRVLERQRRGEFKAVCAWGTSYYEMKRLLEKVDLDFDEYVLHVGRRMTVDLGGEVIDVPLRGLCTFDKRRLILDLHRRVEVTYGAEVRRGESPGGDIVVDATGFHRSLLPRLERDYFIPTLEFLVSYGDPPLDDFYIKPLRPLSGYLWYFPLGNGQAHVGAGDYFKRHTTMLTDFMTRHRGEILAKLGRPVRIAPPHLARPVRAGNIYGVGESVGAVYPVLGEGIIPGMQSAEIFSTLLEDGEIGLYEAKLLNHFKPYHAAFNLIRKKIRHEYRPFPDLKLLLTTYLHMKLREKRYGMRIRLIDWLKVIKTYG